MCQDVTGPSTFIKKPIIAWKVVCTDNYKEGPYFSSKFVNKWAKSIIPSCRYLPSSVETTAGGYHVFNTREAAINYSKDLQVFYFRYNYNLTRDIFSKIKGIKLFKVIKVLIKGQAIPFHSLFGSGFAVESWRKA